MNKCLVLDKIKFEDWKAALLYAKQGQFMFSFDLKSGYHHIAIHKDFHSYLGFSWQFGNEVKYFQFTVLPFGLATAGHIFTKTVRCIVKYWRSLGLKIVVYLDDGLCFSDNFEDSNNQRKMVKSDLKKAGLVSKDIKSIWDSTTNLIWLGIGVDLDEGTIYITDKCIQAALNLISSVLDRPRTTARKLARITGKIVSMSLVFGNITNLMLKYSHMTIIDRITWGGYFNVNKLVIE